MSSNGKPYHEVKMSVLILLNAKHLSQNGDGGCFVHVHMFSGNHEHNALSRDQCVHIVFANTRISP